MRKTKHTIERWGWTRREKYSAEHKKINKSKIFTSVSDYENANW